MEARVKAQRTILLAVGLLTSCTDTDAKPSDDGGAAAVHDSGDGSADGDDGTTGGGSGEALPDEGLAVGLLAPDFTLPDSDGTMVSLSDFRGQRVMVLGTSMWCPSCQELVEKIQEWTVNAAESDQRAISVLIEDATGDTADLEDARSWKESHGLTFPVLADVERAWSEIYRGEAEEYPQRTYMVVDSSGVIVYLVQDGSRGRRSELVDAINAAD